MGAKPRTNDICCGFGYHQCLVLCPLVALLKGDVGYFKAGVFFKVRAKRGKPRTYRQCRHSDGGKPNVIGRGKFYSYGGGIDAHIHFILPATIEEALTSGVYHHDRRWHWASNGTKATTCYAGALVSWAKCYSH